MHPCELKAGPGETAARGAMGATLLAAAASKRSVMTPAEAPGKRHCVKKCGWWCV